MRGRKPLLPHFRHAGTYRGLWDVLICLLLCYVAVYTPIDLGFEVDLGNGIATFEKIVEVIFLVDIALNFRTGYISAAKGGAAG